MYKKNKVRLVFLCSGGGGNLRFIELAIRQNLLPHIEIVEVVTDRKCAANSFAQQQGIIECNIDFTSFGQQELIEVLERSQPDIIITTVHRILHDEVVARFRNKLVNLHYSLLPAFGGVIGSRPVQNALDFGAKFIGTTVHFVDEKLDAGKPLVQVAVPVRQSDSIEELMDLLFRAGCISLAKVLTTSTNSLDTETEQIVKIKDRFCMFSCEMNDFSARLDEVFWAEIKS